MAIKLDDDYRIEKDNYSWNLVFEKFGEPDPKTGKRPRSFDISYHPNIKQALMHYVDKALKSCETIQAIINKIDELQKLILSMDFGGRK